MSTSHTARVVSCTLLAATLAYDVPAQAPDRRDPFAFLQPLVQVSAAERQRIDNGDVLVRVLPAVDGEVALFAASRLDAPAEALVAWTRAIAALKKSPFVLAIGRFSNPPVVSDLASLELDADDRDAIRRCRSGDCGLKLTDREIQALRVAAAAAGPQWEAVVQREFRQLIIDRVSRYRTEGLAGLSPPADRAGALLPREALENILAHSTFLVAGMPGLVDELLRYPRADVPRSESFLYWSKEAYGRGKPVVGVTHVRIVHPGGPPAPLVMVLGQELFATHYRDGSLGVTAVLAGAGDVKYLVYLNRSRLDVLGGLFGGLKRMLVERRLASEVAPLISAIRGRLESGSPPTASSTDP